jgi:hypothetical protein
MTRSLFFIAAVLVTCALTPCLSYGGSVSGNLSIDVVPPGTTPPTPPPQAAAAGYTTLALNQDWTTGPFSIDCTGGDGPGLWHVHRNGILWSTDCTNVHWPYNDNGTQALHMQWVPTLPQGTNVGIGTSSNNDVVSVTFPVKSYIECTKRETEHITPTQEIDIGSGTWVPSGWWSCWTWGSSTQPTNPQGCNAAPTICIEYDVEEEHSPIQAGGWPIGGQYGGGGVNWGGGGVLATFNNYLNKSTGFQPTWCSQAPCVFNDGSTAGPVLDPSNGYHTYGLLIEEPPVGSDPHCVSGSTPIPCIKTTSYRDNQGPLETVWFNAASGNEFLQRNFVMSYVTAGCYQNSQSYSGCSNVGIVAANNVGGKLQLTTSRNDGDCCTYFSDYRGSVVYIKGLGGNVPDGNYYFQSPNCGSSCSDHNPLLINLSATPGGPLLTYAGGYTVASAVMNPLSAVDLYMKSYRVWVGCTAWKSTQC